MTVELIYDKDCPNIKRARELLLQAFGQLGLNARWTEWERSDSNAPDYVSNYGSPTILVDQKDVAGTDTPQQHSNCRIYPTDSGAFDGIPSIESVITALFNSTAPTNTSKHSSRWFSSLATLPGIGSALIPIGACPACWPLYAGIASSLGLGFLLNASFIPGLTTLLLLVALSALGFKAKTRRGYGPFILGLLAVTTLLIGKFVLSINLASYLGAALLVTASIWNAWPKKTQKGSCSACKQGEEYDH